jgi:hypothetical protein
MPNNGNLLEDLVANNGNDSTQMTQIEPSENSSERLLPQNKTKGMFQFTNLFEI